MIGNVVISEVDELMYVVLSTAEEHVPYGESVGTTECRTLKTRCRTTLVRYNRVQLHLTGCHGTSRLSTNARKINFI